MEQTEAGGEPQVSQQSDKDPSLWYADDETPNEYAAF